MRNPIKTVRRVVQVLALAAFVWLLWQARWHGVGQIAPSPWFLRMDPLAALVTWLSPTPTYLPLLYPAIGVLVLTLVFGRVFCGWLCPLGTTIDIADHLFLRRHKDREEQWNRAALKYYVLGVALISALLGAQIAWLADPIPLLTRTSATVAYPIIVGAYNVLAVSGRPVLRVLGIHIYPAEIQPTFSLNLVVLLVFLTILGLSVLSRRYWCRNLCPLGALLAFVGRFGLLKRRVTGCVKCRRCAGECKMGAVPPPWEEGGDYQRTYTAECIQCYDCLVCPKEGISAISLYAFPEGADAQTRASKRHFIAALGLGALYGVSAVTGAGRRATSGKLIRPPGAFIRTPAGIRRMNEGEFRDLCLRCGGCMRACITGGLQPAVTEAGFDGVFTPVLVPKLGHCEQNCTACGQVCPSGALGQFRVEEKKDIKLGLAAVHQDKCLSWRKGGLYRLCLVCSEHCPYGAVKIINYEGRRRPAVDADICVGCGQCEHVCPVKPEAAIVVYRSDVAV